MTELERIDDVIKIYNYNCCNPIYRIYKDTIKPIPSPRFTKRALRKLYNLREQLAIDK